MIKKIKICFVVDSLVVGGANILTFNIIKHLNENKFEVGIVTLFSDDNDKTIINTVFGGKEVKYNFLNFNHNRFFHNVKKLKYILKDYDVINSALENSNFYCSFISNVYLRKLKFIATFHGIDINSIDDSYFNEEVKANWSLRYKFKINILQKFLFKSYTYFISVSQFISEFAIKRYKLDRKKVFTIHHGLDIYGLENKVKISDVMKLKEKYKISPRDFVIGYVGRLAYAKGLEALVSSFAELAYRNKNFKLIIVGEGDRRSYLEELIVKHSIQNQCFLAGLSYEVNPYYKLFDLFILPSFAEGLPLTLLEAMYYKCIVLSSDVGGIPEVISDKVNGFLFPKGDFAKMKFLIEEIGEKSPGLEDVRNRAYRDIIKNFDLKKNLINIENLYIKSQI